LADDPAAAWLRQAPLASSTASVRVAQRDGSHRFARAARAENFTATPIGGTEDRGATVG
jgi:hypothetical protein